MAYFSAIREYTIREVVVVEASGPGEARELIDDEDETMMVLSEVEEDPEIQPGSLQEASKEEIVRYKRASARISG